MPTKKTPTLRPCPFCGDVKSLGVVTCQSNPRVKAVSCVCGAEGPTRTRREDAIHDWNKRIVEPPEQRLESSLRELEEEFPGQFQK